MQLERLKEEIQIEIENLSALVREAAQFLHEVETRKPTTIEIIGAGGILNGFYGGVENLLKRFLKYREAPMPSGGQWHSDMLDLFKDASNSGILLRFDEQTLRKLNEYRRIRHVVRNHYPHLLRWDLLAPHLQSLASAHQSIEKSVLAAMAELEKGGPAKP